MAETDNETVARLQAKIAELDYEGQCKWFLNAFWAEWGEANAETVYTWCAAMRKFSMDMKNSDDHSVDEMQSARFFESLDDTKTAIERRKLLKEIDIDNDKRMGMFEYLLYACGTKDGVKECTISELLDRPQGTNDAIIKAEAELKKVNEMIDGIKAKIADLERRRDEAAEAGKGVTKMKCQNEIDQIISTGFPNTEQNRLLITAGAAVRAAAKSDATNCAGDIWWAGHVMEEAKKYKPKGNLQSSFK